MICLEIQVFAVVLPEYIQNRNLDNGRIQMTINIVKSVSLIAGTTASCISSSRFTAMLVGTRIS